MNLDGLLLKKMLEDRIAESQEDLSAQNINERDADFLRGTIEQCRVLLNKLSALETPLY